MLKISKILIAPFLSYSIFLRGLFFYAAPCSCSERRRRLRDDHVVVCSIYIINWADESITVQRTQSPATPRLQTLVSTVLPLYKKNKLMMLARLVQFTTTCHMQVLFVFRMTTLQTMWNSLTIPPIFPGRFAALLYGTRHVKVLLMIMPVLVLNTCMDANMQLTINSFGQLFPDKISLIFSKIADILLTAVKLPDISRFSKQVSPCIFTFFSL